MISGLLIAGPALLLLQYASGGKTALAAWESIALNDRDVCVVFDSDVATKAEVAGALRRLQSFLEGRGAKVKIIYLPGTDGGFFLETRTQNSLARGG